MKILGCSTFISHSDIPYKMYNKLTKKYLYIMNKNTVLSPKEIAGSVSENIKFSVCVLYKQIQNITNSIRKYIFNE